MTIWYSMFILKNLKYKKISQTKNNQTKLSHSSMFMFLKCCLNLTQMIRNLQFIWYKNLNSIIDFLLIIRNLQFWKIYWKQIHWFKSSSIKFFLQTKKTTNSEWHFQFCAQQYLWKQFEKLNSIRWIEQHDNACVLKSFLHKTIFFVSASPLIWKTNWLLFWNK